ncbi:hypothetical protein BaRGS_00003637 [Batillaria attramentaria]|uniref:Uncharacterized protein n=1 Tax=Batillaria attramentaria TaxID=370345 RepID=A0ABD0LZV3_9CAEN
MFLVFRPRVADATHTHTLRKINREAGAGSIPIRRCTTQSGVSVTSRRQYTATFSVASSQTERRDTDRHTTTLISH